MEMHVFAYLVAYVAILIFVVAVLARFAMWARMPMHLRWELYPVAHEAEKAHYGGSYLEESDWWTKPRKVSLTGELKVMVPEILFLVALKEHNYKLWLRSFPFHFGLYLIIGCTALMIATGILTALVPALNGGLLEGLLEGLIWITGVVGLGLGFLGALGLLLKRLRDPVLSMYSTSGDLFNLIIFIVGFGLALLTFLFVDRDFSTISSFVGNLATFNMQPLTGSGAAVVLPVLSVVALSLMLIYIPMTHMSHFVGKYFAYHSIRWNDEPNLRGGKEEPVIDALLNKKITWAAPHIQGEGKKSWADAASEDMTK
jgi:nitrate reductase gamma subunit